MVLRSQSLRYVKICGISSPEDLGASLDAGADALGFLVGLSYPSEDQLSPEDAARLVRSVPPFVTTVLVTHRTALREVRELCASVPAGTLQLHGDFPVQWIPEIRSAFPYLKIIKAVHVIGEESIDRAKVVADYADAVLLDTRTPTRLGGTGVVHDWSISRAIRDTIFPKPLILAGGLTPANVSDAIAKVQPFAVDVNSGVSARRGLKDPELVRQFVCSVKSGRC
jgi:phosphoribosylanthranilate isomerase